jgi:hypothetical protein
MNVATLLTCVFTLIPGNPAASPNLKSQISNFKSPLRADYVEARTASVFAGPCHVNGELMTTGNDALMAWRFENGVRIMADVSCQSNLLHTDAPRQSEIVIDGPNAVARDAALHAILCQDSRTLGRVVSIRRAPINFQIKDGEFTVNSTALGSLDIQALPDCDCCKQPNNVWYTPLTQLTRPMVGYTIIAQHTSARAGDPWEREDENGAFFGAITYQQ